MNRMAFTLLVASLFAYAVASPVKAAEVHSYIFVNPVDNEADIPFSHSTDYMDLNSYWSSTGASDVIELMLPYFKQSEASDSWIQDKSVSDLEITRVYGGQVRIEPLTDKSIYRRAEFNYYDEGIGCAYSDGEETVSGWLSYDSSSSQPTKACHEFCQFDLSGSGSVTEDPDNPDNSIVSGTWSGSPEICDGSEPGLILGQPPEPEPEGCPDGMVEEEGVCVSQPDPEPDPEPEPDPCTDGDPTTECSIDTEPEPDPDDPEPDPDPEPVNPCTDNDPTTVCDDENSGYVEGSVTIDSDLKFGGGSGWFDIPDPQPELDSKLSELSSTYDQIKSEMDLAVGSFSGSGELYSDTIEIFDNTVQVGLDRWSVELGWLANIIMFAAGFIAIGIVFGAR